MACNHPLARAASGSCLALIASVALYSSPMAQAADPKLDTSQLYADVHFQAFNYAMQGISLKEYAQRYMSADHQRSHHACQTCAGCLPELVYRYLLGSGAGLYAQSRAGYVYPASMAGFFQGISEPDFVGFGRGHFYA